MEADFKGIWGQTWCGAGLWGGHGSFWGPACPRRAPAMLQPLLAQLGPLQPRSAGTGIPTGNRREEFPPAVAGCQEQLQNSKSLLKKKKRGGKREKFPLPAVGWVQPPLLLQGQVRVCPAVCEHPCPPCLSRSSAQSWILLYFHFFDPSQRSVRGNLHFLHFAWHGATGTRGFRAPPSRSCYRWKSQVCST